MKLVPSFLTTLVAGGMVSAKYTTKIPDDAVWVTNWDELHAAPRFGGVLLPKYGGFVIEVDEKIVLATDEQMSKEVLDLLTDLEKNDPQPENEQTTPNKRDLEVRGDGNRCSHPPCFGPGFALSTLIVMCVLVLLAWFSREAGAFESDIYLVGIEGRHQITLWLHKQPFSAV